MKNLKKVLLFLVAVSAISFGNNVKKENGSCKDKNGKTVKCPAKGKSEDIKKDTSKQNSVKSSEKSKTEKKKKERATSSSNSSND